MDVINDGRPKLVTMAHGAGGATMQQLIKEEFLKYFVDAKKNEIEVGLSELDDSGIIDGIVFTTDSHTVKPIFFPGGDIGALSIAGTVNDLAVMGAEPIALSSAFIIEEGFPIDDLRKILRSMSTTARFADVPVITGDLKVVEHGAVEKLFINTAGIGRESRHLKYNASEVRRDRKFTGKWLKDSNLRDGDTIILSGTIGDHGIAVLSGREGYGFETTVKSDVCPINKMIGEALKEGGIVVMKDPTRGGLANALYEWSEKSLVGITINEESIPITQSVHSACEMLGIDPLTIGNEGKAIIGTVPNKAEAVLKALKRTKEGRKAAIIGHATMEVKGVVMETTVGGKRIVDQPAGDPVPRIC